MIKENMQNYKVGMICENECGHCKAPELEIKDDCIIIKFYEHGINEKVVEQLSVESEFDLKLQTFGTFLLFEVKAGNIEEGIFWSVFENKGNEINLETDNYKIYLLLFDTFTGELCAKKQILLSKEKSSYISKDVSYQKEHLVDAARLNTLMRTAERFYLIKKRSKSRIVGE